jgi:hypothetical protein
MSEHSKGNIGKEASIGVVYLAWHALGRATFERFAESYRRQPAGRDHDLIVIYAGFKEQQELKAAASVFRDIPHTSLELTDVKFDIAYYLETVRRVPHKYLCFLNTYTELTTANWLSYLYTHASRDEVGIVGASGSYQSLFDTNGFYQKIVWLYGLSGKKVSESAAHYFNFIIKHNCPAAIVEAPPQLPPHRIDRWMAQTARLISDRQRDVEFCAHWEKLTAPGAAFEYCRRFPVFPNPHIRSNGFMVRRLRLVPFEPSQIQTKMDACAFESGLDSLTAQLRRAGLAAIVVTNDGEGYDVPDWWRSNTFCLGDQSKLLLTDNRTREFASISPGMRTVCIRVTWGDYLGPAPADFPEIGYAFPKASLSPARSLPKMQGRPLAFDPLYISCRFAFSAMQVVTLLASRVRAAPR